MSKIVSVSIFNMPLYAFYIIIMSVCFLCLAHTRFPLLCQSWYIKHMHMHLTSDVAEDVGVYMM